MTDLLPAWLLPLLACPICHGNLQLQPDVLTCCRCVCSFPLLEGPQWIDLFPKDLFLKSDQTEWEVRQGFFRDWLVGQGEPTSASGDEEFFAACARHAGALDGFVLDVGGGDGYLCRWLPADAHYVCLDPEIYPPIRTSSAFSGEARSDSARRLVLRGVGEYLPFQKDSFHTVFCLAALNHCSGPGQMLGEIHRVLRPGGTVILAWEEVPPLLPFLYVGGWRPIKVALRSAGSAWLRAIRSGTKTSWQADHIPLPRRQLHRWLGNHFRLQETFFMTSRGVVEMGQRWQKTKVPSPLP